LTVYATYSLIGFVISVTYTFVVYKRYIEIHLVQVLRHCSTGHSELNKQKFNDIEEVNGRAMEPSSRRFSLPIESSDRKRKVHVRHNLYHEISLAKSGNICG
jgi:hypothetical protein